MLMDEKDKEFSLVKNIINTMLLLSKQQKIYAVENRLVKLTSTRLLGFFDAYFLYRENFQLTVVRHGFMYDEDFVDRLNKAFEQFAYTLFQHGISAIRIQKDLTARDLQAFLSLTTRPPSESWEEGGFISSLRMRNIETIEIREMAESDIVFLDEVRPVERSEALKQKSGIWDRFALAVFHGLSGYRKNGDSEPEDIKPGMLAQLTNQVLAGMSEANKQKFAKGVSNFLTSIQSEKINEYRGRALAKLTDFINRIAPEIRQRLFSNIFNLNLKPQFAEEFYSGLSDEIILEILESSSQDNNYVPPVILKVLGKIAIDKNIVMSSVNVDKKITEKKADIVKLFQKDDFEKYVPDKYRDALINIIRHDNIPKSTEEGLLLLRTTLEEALQERHAADIILKILHESPDPAHIMGLDQNLANIVSLYLDEADYKGLLALWQLCCGEDHGRQFNMLMREFASADFAERIVDRVALSGKPGQAEIESVIVAVGPPFVAPLLERLAVETNRASRMRYLRLLQELDEKQVIAEAVKHLGDQRWFFVRNVIYLLCNLQSDDAVPYLRPLTRHHHPKVQLEAVRACLKFGCRDSLVDLVRMLDDKDQQTVDRGISLAMLVSNPTVTERLILLLQDRVMFDYRLEQKTAIVQVLAKKAQAEALPVFSSILSSSNLVHAKKHESLKEEIVKSLAYFDPVLLGPFIKQLAAVTSGNIQSRLQMLSRRIGADHGAN